MPAKSLIRRNALSAPEDGLGTRERRLESIKYVLGLGCVDAFTIGFTSTDQIDETLELIEEATA